MEPNIYTPPQSKLTAKNTKPGSLFKSVGIGIVIEIVGTISVSIILGILYGLFLSSQGQSPEEVLTAMEQMDPLSAIGLTESFFGLLVSILAGYVCARIANSKSYRSVGILSALSAILGSLAALTVYSWWALLLMDGITIVAILFGGWLHIKNLE
ncbi:MAG: hypothetical protein PVF82_12550 [Gammaproteobacteria bacterium]|jgi:hypothetical protein